MKKYLGNVLYLLTATGMLLYALPKLHIGQGYSLETIFSVSWIGLALLIIAAHLFDLLKVDKTLSVVRVERKVREKAKL